ncbi:MAG: tetratricopeptide repeat protein [Bacteroidales bacterium]|jgi:tetratricopeptide (TPR) repeat protein|nr:tetratricopeptide repeat protein [Bacteroidales bacterium]
MKQFCILCLTLLFGSVSLAQQGSTEQLAIEFLNNGETEKALQLFNDAYSKTPSQHIYRLYLDALLQEKKTRDAERLVQRHQRNFPQNQATAVDLGYVFLISGDKNKADKEFKTIVDKLPSNQNQIAEIAFALFSRGQIEFAVQAFLNGRKILNNPQAFSLDLATLYEYANRIADMTNEYLAMLSYTPDMLSYVQQRVQAVLSGDTDDKKATTEIRKTILEYIQQNPQSRTAQDFWIGLLLSIEDFETALTFARAYDRRFNDEGRMVMEVAQVAQNSHSNVAEKAYQYLISKGATSSLYLDARMGLLSYYYQKITTSSVVDEKALIALEKEYENLLKNNPITANSVRLIRDWARISAFYNTNFEKADSLLKMAMNIPNLSRRIMADVKLDLADIYLFIGEPWEATLLYSQVEKEFKHDEIGFDAKLRNARLSYYIGEFEWSLAQLDVLRAATSKLIANDAMELSLLIREHKDFDESFTSLKQFANAELLIYQRKYDEALKIFDYLMGEKKDFFTLETLPTLFATTHSLHDNILMKRAEIALKRGKIDDALAYLEKIYTQHADELLADDALYLAAKINEEQLGRLVTALALYEQLILEHPSSLYIPDARKRFRELRER